MKGPIDIYYDEEGDCLEIFIGDARPNYGENIASGVTVFKDEETDEIMGVGILNFRKKTKSLKDIELKLPFKIVPVSES